MANHPHQRVLMIPLRFVGDTVLSLQLVDAIHAVWPHCQVDWWASKATAPLVQHHSGIHRVHIEPNRTEDWTPLLKQGRYDAVILLRQSWTMAKRCRQAGIPRVISWDRQRFPKPLGFQRWGLNVTDIVPYPTTDTHVHQLHHQWGFIQALTAQQPDFPTHLTLSVSTEAQVEAQQLMAAKGLTLETPWVLIHGSSASGQKRVDKALFLPAMATLQQTGHLLVITGLANDAAEWQALSDGAGVSIVNLCGQTSLAGLAALAQHALLYLGVDSGPAHLVACQSASGQPRTKRFVILYGPTNAQQWAPYGQQCHVTPVFYQPETPPTVIASALQTAVQAQRH